MTDNQARKSVDTLPKDKDWFFPESTRMFGQYTEHEEFRPLEEYVHLMHRAFRMRREIVQKAIDHLVRYGLKPYQYNAMHVRRNDFQYATAPAHVPTRPPHASLRTKPCPIFLCFWIKTVHMTRRPPLTPH